jgi:hypothetical protein
MDSIWVFVVPCLAAALSNNSFPFIKMTNLISAPRNLLLGTALVLCGFCVLQPALAGGNTEPLTDILSTPGSAGLGFVTRVERSPYKDAGTRYDLLPLYLYEGERLFLHANRGGVKLLNGDERRLDLFVEQRLEGFPTERLPGRRVRGRLLLRGRLGRERELQLVHRRDAGLRSR